MVAVAKPVADEYDPESYGQGNAPAIGKYHFLITKGEEPKDKEEFVIVEAQVCAGTTKDQEGKLIEERFFPFSEKAAPRLMHLFYVTGAATLEQINAGEDLPMSALVGRQFMGEVEFQAKRGYTNKKGEPATSPARRALSYNGIASMTDPEWSDVPKNQGVIDGGGIDNTPLDDDEAPLESGDDPFAS